ncbi:hypothetical protein E4U21_002595 [Claviceps maximensis]|nr:hypothetical protein E4U21_002595 [Claviceps maximensis]
MADSARHQVLVAAFAFGLVVCAALGTVLFNLRGGTSSLIRGGLRLALAGFLLFVTLWAINGFVGTFIDEGSSAACHVVIALASSFDQIARIALEGYLLWAIKRDVRATAGVTFTQTVILLRFILGAIFVSALRPQFAPTCVAKPLLWQIGVAVALADAVIVTMLLTRASAVGVFRDAQVDGIVGLRAQGLAFTTIALGLWIPLSIPMFLNVSALGVAARSALPSVGALVTIGNMTYVSLREWELTNSAVVCIAFFYRGLIWSQEGINHTNVVYVNQFPGLGDAPHPQSRGFQGQEESTIDSASHPPGFFRPRQSTIRMRSNTSETTASSQDGIGILSIDDRPSPEQANAGFRGVSISGQLIPSAKSNLVLETNQDYGYEVSSASTQCQPNWLKYSSKNNPQMEWKEVATPSFTIQGSRQALEPEVESLSQNVSSTALDPSSTNGIDIRPQLSKHILQLLQSDLPEPCSAYIGPKRRASSTFHGHGHTTIPLKLPSRSATNTGYPRDPTTGSSIPRSRFADKNIRPLRPMPRLPPSEVDAKALQAPVQMRAVAVLREHARVHENDQADEGSKQTQTIMVESADRQSVMDRPRPIPRKAAIAPKSNFQEVNRSIEHDVSQASTKWSRSKSTTLQVTVGSSRQPRPLPPIPKSADSLRSVQYDPNSQTNLARPAGTTGFSATISPSNDFLSVYLQSPALTLPLSSKTDPKRKSSPVLPVHDLQESATPASVRADRYLAGPENQVPANRITELQENKSIEDESSPSNEDDGSDYHGTETMTVMLDRSDEFIPTVANTSLPQKTSGWTRGKNGSWHRRVGENCPTFSDRNSGRPRRFSKPPPPPLELEQITRRFKGPAPQISPLTAPRNTFDMIREQLRKDDESDTYRDDTELTEASMMLLQDIETEMGLQENRWQELRVDLAQGSGSTFASIISSPTTGTDQSPSVSHASPATGINDKRDASPVLDVNILEVPVPLKNSRRTLGIYQFPWGERSDTGTLPRVAPFSGQARMGAFSNIPSAAMSFSPLSSIQTQTLQPRQVEKTLQRREQEQDPLFNYCLEFDTAGYASDDVGNNRYYGEDEDDSFDETTLWEIASLLKSDKIPSRQSLFPNQEPHQVSPFATHRDELTLEPSLPSVPRQHTEGLDRKASSPTSAGLSSVKLWMHHARLSPTVGSKGIIQNDAT